MSNIWKRSLSMFLAIVMVLGNVPVSAFAMDNEETPACEHSYNAVTTDATCTEAGSVVYTCGCGDTYTETIPAAGHTWGDWTVTEATYEAAGSKTRTCGVCGGTETEEIPMLVADPEPSEEPEESQEPEHQHDWSDWTVTQEATYEAAGSKTRSCECGETETEEIPQLVEEKEELSGDTRKLYFLNTENWDEVYACWFFDAEDFEDVTFPGEEMEEDEELENVFVIELPVEAVEVIFHDGVEVTEELLAYEAENGIEAIHFFEAELDEELDYFSAEEQVEQEEGQEEVTEWLSYEDVLDAWKKEQEKAQLPEAPSVEEQVAYVNALIDALPAEIGSDAHAEAVEAALAEIDKIVESDAFPAEEYQKLDWAKIAAAYDAVDAWWNLDHSVEVLATEKDILDGKTTDKTVMGWVDGKSTQTQYRINGGEFKTLWGTASEIAFNHNDTVDVRKGWNIGIASGWNDPTSFTIKVYHQPTAALAAGSPNGASAAIAEQKIYSGSNGTVTAANVYGYTVSATYKNSSVAMTLSEGTWSGTFTATDSSAVTVTYTPINYTVKWDLDGDGTVSETEAASNASVAYGSKPATVPTATAQTGKSFAGWKSSVDNAVYKTAAEIPAVSGDVTYTATYTEEKIYTVTYKVDGQVYTYVNDAGEPVTAEFAVNATQNQVVPTVPDPDKANAIFTVWTNADKIGQVPSANVTLDAQWNLNDANDNNIDDGSETATITVSVTNPTYGTVALSGTSDKTHITQNGNVYTVLFDSATAGANVITVTATANDGTNSTAYSAAVDPGTVTVSDNGEYTVNVEFTKTEIKFGSDKNTTIEWNGWYQDGTKLSADALADLKEEIFTKLDIEGATEDQVTIQYYPWFTTRTQDPGYSDEDGLTALNGARQDYSVNIPVVGTVGWTFSEFGQRGYQNGAEFTDTNEKVRITFGNLWIDTEITLTEERDEYATTYAAPTVTFVDQDDIDAAVLAALKAADAEWETIGGTYALAEDQELPGVGLTKELTYNIAVPNGAKYLATADTVTITATRANDRNGNGIEDGTAGDPFTYYKWMDGEQTLKSADQLAGEAAPTAPTDFDTDNNGKLFNNWTESYDEATRTHTYTANWYADTNNNDVDDAAETITVTTDANAEVKVDGTLAANGAKVVYNSKTGATVTITPAKGYYVDVKLDDVAVEEGNYQNTWQSGIVNADYRNVCTVTINANSGNHTLTAQSTKFEFVLPKDAVEVWVSGYLFNGITSVPKDAILTAIYGDTFNPATDSEKYSGNVDEGWGSVTIKLETPFQYKVTLNATAKYPAASDTIMVTAKDNRDYAKIESTYEASDFNTEADFKAAFADSITFNGTKPDFDGLTAIGKNGEISWTKNENGTYTATVKALDKEGWKETTETFENLTWTVSEYTVKFLDKDGGLLSEAKYAYNTPAEEVVKPDAPAVEGHTFNGWTVAKVTDHATYTAAYTVNQYTIIFKDGATEYYNQKLDYGTVITAPTAPEKEGYTFIQWGGYTEGMTVPAEDKTFTASWEANKYTVTWQWTDGQDVPQELKKEYYYGTTISLPGENEIPAQFVVDENTTKTITGWNGWSENMPVQANNDLVFTATYTTEKTYTATFLSDGENYAKQVIIPTDDATENDNVTKPADPTKTGFRFDGWFTDAAFAEETEFTAWNQPITDDITLYAKWVQQVTVTFDVESIENQTFDINTKATKPADPDKANAIFGGWFNGETEFNFDEVVTENVDLTAKWIADVNDNNVLDENETITITIEGEGTVTIDGAIYVEPETVEEIADETTGEEAAIEPVAEAAAESAKSGEYIFDSVNNPKITITATPVVADGYSKSYVKQIGAKNTASLTFDAGFAATETIEVKAADEIKVLFEDVPVLKDPVEVVEYNFYTREIPYEDIYASVVEAPALVGENTTYTYFARPAMKHTVSIDSLDLDSSIKTLLNTIGIKEFSFDMKELWLPLDAQIEESVDLETAVSTYLTKDRINGLLDIYNAAHDKAYDEYIAANGSGVLDKIAAEAAAIAAGSKAALADIQAIYDVVYASANYYGAHNFGYNATGAETVEEKIKIAYNDPSMKWETEATVILKDSRAKAFISGSDVTVTYRDYLDQDLLDKFDLVDENGNAVEGEIYSIQLEDPYTFEGKNVSETTYELLIKFAGNENYRPAEKTFHITVVKADLSIDLPNLNITYGDTYDPYAKVILGNQYGDKQEVIDSLVEIFIGLDVNELTIGEDGKPDGLATHIQITLPQDDTLATLFKTVGLDVYGEEGETLSLGEMQEYLGKLGDLIGGFDSDSEMVSGINNILQSVTDLVDLSAVEITIGGKYPSDIGVYLYGAVSTSGNYETAYDVAYMLIKPKTTEYKLEWNEPALTNALVTLPVFQTMDKGAHAIESEDYEAAYLILGINDETGDIYEVDINGNIKLNIWSDPTKINANGAYLQIAYGIEWGNEMDYAIPIIRSFAIVPALYEVELVGATGEPNNELLKTFNNQEQGFGIIVKDNDNNILYSDHYQNATDLQNANAQLIVTYTGVQTNGQLVNLTTVLNKDNIGQKIAKPVHAGAYAVTAFYMETTDGVMPDLTNLDTEDLYELFDLVDVGMNAGLLVIQPAPSETVVDDVILTKGDDFDLMTDMVHVTTDSGVTSPDMTIISAQIASDGSFDEIGWDAVTGNVNVAFPDWLDAVLTEYAPDVKANGITPSQFTEKLNETLPDILGKLEEANASAEILNSLTNLVENISNSLAHIPDSVKLTFDPVDEKDFDNVGAYVITAIVTDSDHLPSADSGILLVQPQVKQYELEWNYEDENGIWTRELLNHVDLWATAFAKGTTNPSEEATAKITYKFIGVDKTGELIVKNVDDVNALPNGAYIQLAYIELDASGYMDVSDLIARPVVLIPGNAEITMEDKTVTFNGSKQALTATATINGEVVEAPVVITYTGVQTNGKVYGPTTVAPIHAGVYAAMAEYKDYTVGGSVDHYGVTAAMLTITPCESEIKVTGGKVTYNGEAHTAKVEVKGLEGVNSDYTLISGGVYVSGDAETVGVDAFHGNLNIKFPAWFEDVLNKNNVGKTLSPADLVEFIENHRGDLDKFIPVDELTKLGVAEEEIAAVVQKLNGYIDKLVEVLKLMPQDVTLTRGENVSYTEPGAYGYIGIVTDSDRYPSYDTGLLVIEKKDLVYDLTDTTVTWDGKGHMTDITNPENTDAVTVIIDRTTNNINILLEQDAQYLLNKLAALLKPDFDGDVQLSTIIKDYAGEEVAAAIVELISKAEDLQISEEITKALAAVKTELESLPAEATITINGDLPSEVGEYEVYAITYSQYFKTAASEADLNIVPVQVKVELDDNSKIYGAEDPALTYTVKYFDHEGNELADADAVTVAVERAEGEDVGHYAINATVTLKDEKHYVLSAEPAAADFEITPANLTVVIDNQTKVYGEKDPEFTYTVKGLTNGDTAEGVKFLDLSREIGENVGEYTIKAQAEYANYNVNVEYGTLTITKANVSITVADASKVYGEKDPEKWEYKVEGLANGDQESVLGIKTKRDAGENVGEYQIAAYWLDDLTNYNVIANVGTFTITKATVTVDVEDAQKVYGTGDPDFTATVNGLKFTDTLDIKYTRAAGENVGEYEISAEAENANYDILFNAGKLTITPAQLTISADNQTKVYGNADPALTFTADGLVNGDTKDMLGITVTRMEGNNVGIYEITAAQTEETVTLGNYNVTWATGSMEITPAELVVTVTKAEKFYGETDEAIVYDYTVDGYKHEDTKETVPVTFARAEGQDGENAGQYEIVASVESKNYTVKTVDGKLTIKPAEITVVIKDAEKVVQSTEDPAFEHEVVVNNGVLTDEEIQKLNIQINRAADEDGKEELGETYVLDATHVNNDKDTTNDNGNVAIEIETATLTITLGDYVCWNVQEGIYYNDLSLALETHDDEAEETIQMLKDYDENYVIVAPGTTLDLNGKTVTARFVVGLNESDVVDEGYKESKTNIGLLVVPQNNIELASTNRMLPVWNINNGYGFTDVAIIDNSQGEGITENEAEDTMLLEYVTFYRHVAMLNNNVSDHDVSIIVRASWTNATGTVYQDYVFSDEHARRVIDANGSRDFELTFNGYSKVQNLKLTAMVVSENGVEIKGTQFIIN